MDTKNQTLDQQAHGPLAMVDWKKQTISIKIKIKIIQKKIQQYSNYLTTTSLPEMSVWGYVTANSKRCTA